MWKVVGLLKGESAVHTNPRGAIFAGPQGAVPVDESSTRLLWERLMVRLGRDVMAGALGGERLPPVTKLALRYGVTARTMRKALTALVSQHVLAREGHRYVPSRKPTHHLRATMVLISYGASDGTIALGDPRIPLLVESFERECARLGYDAQIEGFNEQDPQSLIDISAALQRLPAVPGVIVNLWSVWNETYFRRWCDLFRFLAGRQIPVIMIDQSGNLSLPRELLASRYLKILRISSEGAGERVAEAMARVGHERIAFITPYFNAPWVRHRYTGLCRYLKRFGGPRCAVELHAVGEMADQNDLNLAIMGLDKDELRILYRDSLSDGEIEELTARLGQKPWQELRRKTVFADRFGTIRKMANFTVSLADGPHDKEFYSLLLETLHHIVSNQAIEDYLTPFFRDIFEKSTATAWVCSDDKTALTAVSFLRGRG